MVAVAVVVLDRRGWMEGGGGGVGIDDPVDSSKTPWQGLSLGKVT